MKKISTTHKDTPIVKPYRFVSHADEQYIKEIDRDFVVAKLANRYGMGADNITSTGTYKLMGWAYDVRPFLTKYLYKQHGSWHEMYAINASNLRKLAYGKVDQIINLSKIK